MNRISLLLSLALLIPFVARAQYYPDFNGSTANPFNLSNAPAYNGATLADWDDDGDLDIMMSTSGTSYYFIENTGNSSSPNFGTPIQDPFSLGTLPALHMHTDAADLDNDGDLDLLASSQGGAFYFFENIGSASSPVFDEPVTNPFGLISLNTSHNEAYSWGLSFADMDGDGDLDLWSGSYSGSMYYFENTGTASNPSFGTVTQNPFNTYPLIYLAIDGSKSFAYPKTIDADADGDLDLFIGIAAGSYIYYENIGSETNVNFKVPKITDIFGLTPLALNSFAMPEVGDLDDNGGFDILMGSSTGVWRYFQNTSGNKGPKYEKATPFVQNLTETSFDLHIDMDRAGTFYYIIDADGSDFPNVTQLKSGLNAAGENAFRSGSLLIDNDDFVGQIQVSGLSSETNYDIYFIAEDTSAEPELQLSIYRRNVSTFITYSPPIFATPFDLDSFTNSGFESTTVLPSYSSQGRYYEFTRDIKFTKDGKTFFFVGSTGSYYFSFSLSTPYDLSSIVSHRFIDVAGYTQNIEFNPDGSIVTRLVWIPDENPDYFGFNQSFPGDTEPFIPSWTEIQMDRFEAVLGQGGTDGMAFDNSGLRFFTSPSSGIMRVHYLIVPYDLRSLQGSETFSLPVSLGEDFVFSKDGRKLFGANMNSSRVIQYNLGSPFDLSTMINIKAKPLGYGNYPAALEFNEDGTKMFVGYVGGATIEEFRSFPLDSISTVENQTDFIHDFNAFNGESTVADEGITYSIIGGDDAQMFTIDQTSGRLSFVSPSNFEEPADANLDNIYRVTVQADNGQPENNLAQLNFTVMVTDDGIDENQAYALKLGENQYLQTSDVVLSQNDDFTMETWFNIEEISGNEQPIMYFGEDGPWIGLNNGKLKVSMDGQNTHFQSPVAFSPSKWNHVAATYTANTKEVSVYLNGNKIEGVLDVDIAPFSTTSMFIGGNDSTHDWFKGRIDEVRLWNYARNISDIRQNKDVSLQGDETGLQLYYNFRYSGTTTYQDVSLNNKDASITGINQSNWVEGYFPSYSESSRDFALDFDGTNDFALLPQNALYDVYDFDQGQPIDGTYEAWINTEDAGSGYRGIVVHQLAAGIYLHDNEFIAFDYGYGTNRSTGVLLNDGKWHHVAFAFRVNEPNGSHLYIDGELKATFTYGTSSKTQPVVGAGSPQGTIQNFKGKIDDVRIWNRRRTQSEIQNFMNYRLDGTETGLVTHLRFNEGEGNTAIDASSNNLNASLTNMDESDWVEANSRSFTTIHNSVGWRMISSPTEATFSEFLEPVWTQGGPGADGGWSYASNVVKYDAETDSYVEVKNFYERMEPGVGYLLFHFNDDDYDGVENTRSTRINALGVEHDNPEIKLNSTTNGWTLVGNPFKSPISWSSVSSKSGLFETAYVWDPRSSSWRLSSSEPVIAPFQAFFVQTFESNPLLSIGSEAKGPGRTFLGKVQKENHIELKVVSDHFEDRMRLELRHDSDMGRDKWDAYKLEPLSEDYIRITLEKDGVFYSNTAIPNIDSETTFNLYVESSKPRTATLSVHDLSLQESVEAKLLDNSTGQQFVIDKDFNIELELQATEKMKKTKSKSPTPVITTNLASKPGYTLIVSPKTATSNEASEVPSVTSLHQNYPNPFNPNTTIRIDVSEPSEINVVVWDVIGRKVATIVNKQFTAGSFNVNWNANQLSSGIYFYTMTANGELISTKKMTLVK